MCRSWTDSSGARHEHGGVVDQDVETAQFGGGRVNRADNRLRVAHVQLHRHCVSAGLSNLLGHRANRAGQAWVGRGLIRPRRHRHRCAVRRQAARNVRADAPARTRHQRLSSVQQSHRGSPSRRRSPHYGPPCASECRLARLSARAVACIDCRHEQQAASAGGISRRTARRRVHYGRRRPPPRRTPCASSGRWPRSGPPNGPSLTNSTPNSLSGPLPRRRRSGRSRTSVSPMRRWSASPGTTPSPTASGCRSKLAHDSDCQPRPSANTRLAGV